jgi:hypothetical protein
VRHIYHWGCGRTATFALFLLAAGIALAACDKLTPAFVGLAGVLQGMVTVRAASDDHKARRDAWTDEQRAAAATAKP